MTSNSNDINSEVIKLQMKKITQSDKFLSSDRFTRFLKYVVNQTLSGHADKIKEYSIGLDVFDKSADFAPQLDPIVRIYAGRLRQALNDYYYSEGKNDAIRIEIPKGTYVPVFSCHIDNIKNKEKNNIEKNVNTKFKKHYLKFFVIGFLGLGLLTYFLIRTKIDFQKDELGRTSIEIETFKNLSHLSQNDIIISRLREQTEIALGQFSSMLLNINANGNNSHKPKYTVTGSLNQDKDIINIKIKLIDNEAGVQVLAKEYNESLNTNSARYIEEVFANKIAVDLADEFGELQKFRLRSAQKNETELLPHEAVMLYYDYLANMNKLDNEKIIIELQKTVKEFSKYEPAWSAMSGLYMDKYKHFDGDLNDVVLAKEAIKKAEIINPRSVHVQNHLALIALSDKNLNDFYTAFEKQRTLNPNSTMLGQVGLWLCLIGDYDQGISLIEDAKSRNPYYPRFFHFGKYLFYLDNGDYDHAYLEVEKVRTPLLYWDPLLRASTLGLLGRKEEGLLALNELLELKPNFSENGNETMRRTLYLKKHQDFIIQGLEKLDFQVLQK